MSWTHVETDDRHRLTFNVFRCSLCKRLAVVIEGTPRSECICKGKR
jgi:hypothetical protein